MNLSAEQIVFGNEKWLLTNQRAIFRERTQTLILSDLHMGKAAHFRKHGIALPTQVSLQDITRLENLLLHYQPQKLIVVGDLLHAGANKEVALITGLIQKFSDVQFILVKGNHDRFPDYVLQDMGLHEIHTKLTIEGVSFIHDKPSADGLFITGHIHPGVSLQFPDKRKLSLPCYVVSQQQIILPAFSLFTGLATTGFPADVVCYAIYEDGIFKLS